MSDLFPVTRADMIAEIERELSQRARVYPRLIADGKLTRDKADRQVAVLRSVLELLRGGNGEAAAR